MVYKAFIQESHLSILIFHWNTKSYGGYIWWCWQILHVSYKTSGVHVVAILFFSVDANGTCIRRIKLSKLYKISQKLEDDVDIS